MSEGKHTILRGRFNGNGGVAPLSDAEREANIAEFWTFLEGKGIARPACAIINGDVPDQPIKGCAICPSRKEHGMDLD